ncbi:MAG: Ig-like domain-containing protein, partial [Gemmatimonadota bacterium]
MSSTNWPSVEFLRVLRSFASKSSVASSLFVTFLLTLVACGDDSDSVTGPRPAATVVITPDSAEVVVGRTVQLTVTVRDQAGAALMNPAVTWSSSDSGVAEVDSTGLVSGEAPGWSLITATCEGKADTSSVVVTTVPVDSLEISPSEVSVLVGQSVQLTAKVWDAEDNELTGRVVTWSSSDRLVASVDSTGLVTGMAEDTATITAISEGKADTASVT